jgi:preprotein translocase subunit SecG
MATLLTIIHISVALFLIVIVLLQHGKGADMGAAFGGGSSQTLFGTEGPMPLMNKITTSAAVIFMLTSVSLAYMSAHQTTSVMRTIKAPAPVEDTAPPQVVTVPMPTEAKPAAEPPVDQKTAQ